MKPSYGLILVLLTGTANAVDETTPIAAAVEAFQRIITPTENAAGFHSLEMPKLRDFSPDVPITVDAECLRFAIVTGNGDRSMCRKHVDIRKMTIAPMKDDWYGKSHPGDYQILVNYKGLGKLIILTVSTEDVDPFINAVRVLSPSLKKIKDLR